MKLNKQKWNCILSFQLYWNIFLRIREAQEKRKEELRLKFEEDKKKRAEERLKEKERKKEETRIMRELIQVSHDSQP